MRERFDDKFQVSTGKNHNDTSKECFPCEGGYCQMSPAEIKDFIEQELKKERGEILQMIEHYLRLARYGNDDDLNPVYERAFEEIINTIKNRV